MPMVFLRGISGLPGVARCIRAAGWCRCDYGCSGPFLDPNAETFSDGLSQAGRAVLRPAPDQSYRARNLGAGTAAATAGSGAGTDAGRTGTGAGRGVGRDGAA